MFMYSETTVSSENLVDIRDVRVDRSLPRNQRVSDYIRQIGNPHHFRCGKFVVHTEYADNGVSLEDCLQGILR